MDKCNRREAMKRIGAGIAAAWVAPQVCGKEVGPSQAGEPASPALSGGTRESLPQPPKRLPFGAEGFDLKQLRTGMAMRREPTNSTVRCSKTRIDDIPCEWVMAPGADPGVRLLYLHGGGYVSGSGAYYIPMAAHISAAAQCAVLLPDYRLAPEHRFAAAQCTM
jgi:acetyl esterase/lipase